jgi:hypothetical protein
MVLKFQVIFMHLIARSIKKLTRGASYGLKTVSETI